MTDDNISIGKIFQQIVDEELERQAEESDWAGAPFEGIRKLQVDPRGQVGEKFIATLLEKLGHQVEYSNVTDARNKHWDLKVDGRVNLEIKTASRGKKQKTFQHEGLERNRQYDVILLLDIAPDEIYMSMYTHASFPWSGTGAHRRHYGTHTKFTTYVRKLRDSGKSIETLADFKAAYNEVIAELNKNK